MYRTILDLRIKEFIIFMNLNNLPIFDFEFDLYLFNFCKNILINFV